MHVLEYKESFLEEQVLLVNDIQKDWSPKVFKQTTDFYKQIFKRPKFNPNLNLYAFQGDKIVGILNSFSGARENELTIEIYEIEPNVSEILLKELKNRLKGSSINSLILVSGEGRKSTFNVVKKYKFEITSIHSVYTTAEIKSLTIPEKKFELVDYIEERDFKEMLNIFVNNYGVNREMMSRELTEMYKLKDLIINWKVLRISDKLVAFNLLLLDNPEDKESLMRSIQLDTDMDKEPIFDSFFNSHLIVCKNEKIDKITIKLRPEEAKDLNFYEKYGFKFSKLFNYELKI